MRPIGNAAWTCVVACILLNGCRDANQETKSETSMQSASKGASDEVTLTAEAQAEQKIEVAPVESGVAVSRNGLRAESPYRITLHGASVFSRRAGSKTSTSILAIR